MGRAHVVKISRREKEWEWDGLVGLVLLLLHLGGVILWELGIGRGRGFSPLGRREGTGGWVLLPRELEVHM